MRRAAYLVAAIAALHGAAGVSLAAAAAHLEQSPLLTTGSSFLMIHAAAGLGLAALAAATREPSRFLATVAFALQSGVTLFSLDLALRGLGPGKLFPNAAPIGGSVTIAAWAALAIWASARFVREFSAPRQD
jgi:uncharacterized membrane protein YgdD (TMEM256/DUF423 family)